MPFIISNCQVVYGSDSKKGREELDPLKHLLEIWEDI